MKYASKQAVKKFIATKLKLPITELDQYRSVLVEKSIHGVEFYHYGKRYRLKVDETQHPVEINVV